MNELINIIYKIENILCGPLFIIFLLGSGLFFTIYLRFPQLRFLKKSITTLFGSSKHNNKIKGTTPFQALATSLGGSMGVGCIAGTGVAMNIGGPTSILWMIISTFFGMTIKYVEVLLSHKYRIKEKNTNTYSGGPMFFLKNQLNLKWLGALMALATISTAFFSGNIPQANSMVDILFLNFGYKKVLYSTILSVIVGFIIFGGIDRISKLAEKLIPLMSLIYLFICFFTIFSNFRNIVPSLKSIFSNPFNSSAAIGGFLGGSFNIIVMQGINMALFTSEAGCGASGMAHSSSTEENSFNEALSALLEPFLSTTLMCTISALVLMTSGTWNKKIYNLFDHKDLIVLNQNETNLDIPKIQSSISNNEFLSNKNLVIENGKIRNLRYSFLYRNSICEDITIKKGSNLYNGSFIVKNGKLQIPGDKIKIYGKSLTSGVLPIALAFKRTKLGKLGPILMNVCLLLFALTTILAWFYYIETSLIFLGFGKFSILTFKIIYPIVFFLGSLASLSLVWTLAKMSYAIMTIPCLIGMLLMSKSIKKLTKDR